MRSHSIEYFSASAGLFGFLVTGQAPASTQAEFVSARPHQALAADTLDPQTYDGWKRYRLVCDRCHGEDAQGTTFGPSLLEALKPTGAVPSKEAFVALMASGRPARGMPPAAKLGLTPEYFDGLYDYLQGRSAGRFSGGRPVRRDK